MYVYKITNRITKKSYIGQTINSVELRWAQHCQPSSSCTRLKNAIQKYGKESFEIKILSNCSTIEEMNHRESYYIKIFSTLSPNGYNLDSGGNNSLKSEETKLKLSESVRKAWENPKLIEEARMRSLGHITSEEQKMKTSNSLLGHQVSDETRKKQSAAKLGKPSWNKGLVGIMKPNEGSFAVGKQAPNKGRKKYIIDGKIRYLRVPNGR